jgi:hypothetical protein
LAVVDTITEWMCKKAMRDYLNSNEKNQFMVINAVLQMALGIRNEGKNGPDIQTMREEWMKLGNLTKEEHKNLKFAETYLSKFIMSVYNRLSSNDQEYIRRKLMRYDFKLVDDYTLTKVNRETKDCLVNAAVPRNQFNDWCSEIMHVQCNGCAKDWNGCQLHDVFEDNFIPESGFNKENCKYAYNLDEL